MHFISKLDAPVLSTKAKPLLSLKDPCLNLLTALSYEQDNLPYAQVLAQYYGLSGDCLIVSPISWEASHNDVIMSAQGPALCLDEHEARRYFSVLEAYFKEDGHFLHWHDQHTWLLQKNNSIALLAPPVTVLAQQSLMPIISSLGTEHYWARILTEVQMLFAHLSFESVTSRFPVNGVWIWGGGNIEQKTNRCIKTDDEHALSLFSPLTHHVELYQGLNEVDEDDLIVLMNAQSLDYTELNCLRRSMPIYYYGIEHAYLYPQLSLLDRLLKRY